MNHITGVKLHILSTTSPFTATPVQHRGESIILQKSSTQIHISLKRSIAYLVGNEAAQDLKLVLILLQGFQLFCSHSNVKPKLFTVS